MEFDLKNFLKNLKLNENNISMLLGALVIIVVGVLVVNYFKDKGGQTLNGVNTQQEQLASEHVVVKGETLWSIAEDSFGSGYNWVDIKSVNNLASETIEIGQKLTIPDVPAKKPTATTKTVSVTQTSTIGTNSYTVVHGDTLWNIAIRAYGDGYKWVNIASENNLTNPDLIHPGNVLTIPR